jgi:putative flavoprotein involved in K+ transport
MSARHEVIVVGGGQAGLAIGHYLAEQGRDFVILEAGSAPAAAWRERWDSLVLFTPVRNDALPGKPFPGDPDHYPTRDEVVAYLEDYARDLPVELNSRVTAVRQAGDGLIVDVEDGRSYEADQVVIATGPFQVPFVPPIASRLGADVVQLHSTRVPQPGIAAPRGCARGGRRQHGLPDR